MACTCQKCGKKYKVDILVKDEIWEKIKPKGKAEGSGLFCGSCIIDALELNGYSAFVLTEAVK